MTAVRGLRRRRADGRRPTSRPYRCWRPVPALPAARLISAPDMVQSMSGELLVDPRHRRRRFLDVLEVDDGRPGPGMGNGRAGFGRAQDRRTLVRSPDLGGLGSEDTPLCEGTTGALRIDFDLHSDHGRSPLPGTGGASLWRGGHSASTLGAPLGGDLAVALLQLNPDRLPPRSFAARSVVPLPMNGSSTVPPSGHENCSGIRAVAIGFWVGWSTFPLAVAVAVGVDDVRHFVPVGEPCAAGSEGVHAQLGGRVPTDAGRCGHGHALRQTRNLVLKPSASSNASVMGPNCRCPHHTYTAGSPAATSRRLMTPRVICAQS